jgi:hypothetical protein
VRFRITYARYAELAADVQQMAHGGILVRVTDVADLAFEAPIELELALPDGTSLQSAGKVLQVLAGHGVAVTVQPDVIEQARRAATAGRDTGAPAAAKHERIDRSAAATPAPRAAPREEPSRSQSDEPSRPQKIQIALHGNRDQRNAILRDRDRQLHLYVLKNPGINVDDVLSIAKNPQMGQEMFKQIAERADWLQRPQIATALARNPKVPADIAVRALAHVPQDVLRQFAKGTGAPPHVIQAARKRVLGK